MALLWRKPCHHFLWFSSNIPWKSAKTKKTVISYGHAGKLASRFWWKFKRVQVYKVHANSCHVIQGGKWIKYDQKKGVLYLVPDITGRTKRQFCEDSLMEDMDGKNTVIRNRIFVCHDLLVEKCQGKVKPSMWPCFKLWYAIVIVCIVESNRSRNHEVNGLGKPWTWMLKSLICGSGCKI